MQTTPPTPIPPQPPLRILGIDPGTRHVGFGIVEAHGDRLRYFASGTIHAKGTEIADRLVQIHVGLQKEITAHRPTVAAIETVFAGKNPSTAIAIGEGRGVAMLSAAEAGLRVVGYEPAAVKAAVTGSGRASKEQIQHMVRVLLALPHPPATDHEADALAMAITHARHAARNALLPVGARSRRTASGRRPPRR